MISLKLPESTDAKLQRLARPFESREALIDRIADAELARRKTAANGGASTQTGRMVLDPHSHPSLTHTKVHSAAVEGRPVNRPDWNTVMDLLHIAARKKLGSIEAVRQASSANIRPGKHSREGYRYLAEADLSVQGVDANRAWGHTLRLAQALNVSVEVAFAWRDRADAANPGKTAVLRWSPPEEALPTDVFAEMSPLTVRRGGVDDSRESIYQPRRGE